MLQKPSNVHHSMHVARLWSIEMHACTWRKIMPRVAQYVKYNKAWLLTQQKFTSKRNAARTVAYKSPPKASLLCELPDPLCKYTHMCCTVHLQRHQ